MKVSVILPIYNGGKTLARTLDSLLHQTFQDFELVTCIDGSKDNSLDIINGYKNKFKKIIILENKTNLGLGPTMNRLVAYSNGEYLAVAEQDDVYVESRLEIQVDALDTNPEFGMCSGIAEHFNYNDNISTFKFPGLLVNNENYPKNKEDFFLLNYINGVKVVNSCMMFRKSVHIDNGLYFSKHLGSVSVDWLYVLRFLKVSNIKGINKTLVILDRTPSRTNVTSNKTNTIYNSFELLRMVRFEEPLLITKKIYKKAHTFQNRLEFGHLNNFNKVIRLFIFPLDVKFKLEYLVKMVFRKFKK
ncbi:glycosyltransferase family 2 protein [Flavobacterium sp.]|uniref:glycosyltransferase family 2 protein n=1 Tax=Flavobacterium sp. TaxID=239 RepID=UPI0038FC9BE6